MAKLLFGGVHLDHEVDRLGGIVGLAYAHTSYFRSFCSPVPGNPQTQGYTIELDTDTSLVTVTAAGGAAVVVPRERVKRFEPLPPAVAEVEEKRGPGRPKGT